MKVLSIIAIIVATAVTIWLGRKMTTTVIERSKKRTDDIIKQNERFIEQYDRVIEILKENENG